MGNLACGCFQPPQVKGQTGPLGGLSATTTMESVYYEEAAEAKNLVGSKLEYSSLISLIFGAKNLPDKSQEKNGVKSELFAILYESNQDEFVNGQNFQEGAIFDVEKNSKLEICRTQIIDYSENPTFQTPLNIRYDFERLQYLKVVLVLKENMVAKEATREGDDKGQQIDISQCTLIGQIVFILSELLLLENQQTTQNIDEKSTKTNSPILELQATERTKISSRIEMLFHAKNLSSKDGLDSLSPYLVINQKNVNDEWVSIYRTEVRFNQDEAHWKVIQMTLGQLNLGDVLRPIKLDVFNWDDNGQQELIGSLITDTRELLEKYEDPSAMELRNSNDILSGFIFVRRCEINPQPSLLEYFQGGVTLNLMIGIDYTASNGQISSSNSLHYFEQNSVNSYEEVIRGFGEVLQPYLGGQEIQVWGFGGKPVNSENVEVQQDFEVGVGCQDVEDVINAYHQSLQEVAFSGPGILTPIIQKAMEAAGKVDEDEVYHILLIVTDGEVNHDSKFLEGMIQASQLPLSIIIVGVGDEDFQGMAVLDTANQKHLEVDGISADRDIIQFVKLEDYVQQKTSMYERVLAQIPRQFMEFMKNKSGVVNVSNPLTSQGPVTMRPLRTFSLADRQTG